MPCPVWQRLGCQELKLMEVVGATQPPSMTKMDDKPDSAGFMRSSKDALEKSLSSNNKSTAGTSESK